MKKFKLIWLALFTFMVSNFCWSQDGCLSFDGTNDYVEADNTALNGIGSGDFTFEAWVNGELAGQNAHPTIFSNRPVSGTGALFFFHNNWGGSAYKMLCVQLGGVNYFVFDNGTYDATFFDGTCHHVAITREGSLLSFYADGVFFGTRTIGGGADPSAGSGTDLWIGQDSPTNNTYNGHLSQIRIWDDVRTETEIFDNKDVSIAGGTPNLVGYWELDEGAGDVAADLTGTADGELGSTAGADANDPTWGEDCCIACEDASACWETLTVCDGTLIDLDTLLCDTATLGGTWSGTGVTGSIFDPAGLVGDIAITYDVGADPCDATLTQNITVVEGPSIDAGLDQSICEGEDVTLTADNPDGADIVWDMGVTDGVAFIPAGLGTTTYTVTASDMTGCENISTVDVTVNPIPDVTAAADEIEICLGESVTLTGGGATTYVWDGGVTDGVPHTPASSGTFTFTVTGTTAEGCSSTATITVTVLDCEVGEATFTLPGNVCVGDCITIMDESSGTIAEWAWDFGGAADPNTSDEQNPVVCFNTAGVFDVQLTITSFSGTTSSTTNSITVHEFPDLTARLDTIIDIGDEANLIATSSFDGIYSWEPENDVACPDCPITTASPQDSTTYTVYFVDENGCSAQASVLVLVNFIRGIGVPTAFSPNGDGYNDILFVKGYGINALHFIIYNRYGEVVFESSDQNIGWDGTFKNRDENPGVFTWVVHYDLFDGNKGMIKGNSTLVR